MGKTVARLGRPPVRQREIAGALRRDIVAGRLPPGSRLPIRLELQARYNASSITVQSALNTLAREGFTEARGRSGTFVTAVPPHVARFALVVPGSPRSNRFWATLVAEAEQMRPHGAGRFVLYDNMAPHAENPAYTRLVADIQHRRLAGLIFAAPPFAFTHTPLLEEPGLPRVAFMSPARHNWPVATVSLAGHFAERALARLAARGRRRVAVVTAYSDETRFAAYRQILDQALAAARLEMRPAWLIRVGQGVPGCAFDVVRLLFERDRAALPDALMITDDNLTGPAVAGLLAAGQQVPGDVEVLSHCNYPLKPECPVPVHWLGYSARAVLETCIQALDLQRQGLPPAAMPPIPLQFEEEVIAREALEPA